jgi:hypothetical protein
MSQGAAPFAAKSRLLQQLRSAQPFQDNDGQLPLQGAYNGPFFKLNHAWPTASLPPLVHAPWQEAIHNSPLTPANAPAYAAALKAAVTANARKLLLHYDTWDAAKAGWYNEPWLGALREAIHGTYEGSRFDTTNFPDVGTTFSTRVLTYYDARAAASLNRFWGASAIRPALQSANAQFDEGSLIVKVASFASLDSQKPRDWWAPLKGAQVWNVFVDPTDKNKPQVWPSFVMQFDIIVKDSQSSPRTGWVFMTLVYDASVPGDFWDKMVPLGVQWGNDPEATTTGQPLKENWINMATPSYARATLGWNGRLSGPNDGASNLIAYNGTATKTATGNSSCMSCHSTAQWNATTHQMDPSSFLLPSFPRPANQGGGPPFQTCGSNGVPDPHGNWICSPAPASAAWMKWFQDRKGNQAMDSDSFATDFDEVFAFKSLGAWWAATGPANQAEPLMLMGRGLTGRRFNQYSGAPLPDRK